LVSFVEGLQDQQTSRLRHGFFHQPPLRVALLKSGRQQFD